MNFQDVSRHQCRPVGTGIANMDRSSNSLCRRLLNVEHLRHQCHCGELGELDDYDAIDHGHSDNSSTISMSSIPQTGRGKN